MRVSETCKLKERVYSDFKNVKFRDIKSSLMRVNWIVVLPQEFSLKKKTGKVFAHFK